MPEIAGPSLPAPPPHGWAVSLSIAATVEVGGLGPLPRAVFLEWLWERLADCGLEGVWEGAVSASEAAAHGFEPTDLVIDSAAAPRDRDWVAELPVITARCWLADEAGAREAAHRLAGLAGCDVGGVEPLLAEGADDWRTAFPAIVVPGFGWVRPAWEPGAAGGPAGATTLFIEPGIGFGTGLHPTTQLCLAAIAAAFRESGPLPRVLDFGSGSGILAVAAAVLGAARVDAVECDAAVHEAIRAHAGRNAVADRIRVVAAVTENTTAADLVVANIVARVLIEQADTLCGLVARNAAGRRTGGLVLAGLRETDVAEVAEVFSAALGSDPRRTSRDGWESLVWPGRPGEWTDQVADGYTPAPPLA